jgi:predicted transposase YdaD
MFQIFRLEFNGTESTEMNQGGREAGRQGGREAGRQGGREAGRQGGRQTLVLLLGSEINLN